MLGTVEEFCRRIAGPQLAQAVMEELSVLDLAHEPTRHPYGFYIWKLAIPAAFGFSLRLHAWLPEARPRQKPDWPAHNHHADLHSLVLKGQVSNHEWDWQPAADGGRALYAVGYDAHLSILDKTAERGFLIHERIQSIGPLEDYTVPGLRFHASEVAPSAPAVTLVLFSTRGAGASRVAGDPQGAARYVFDRQEIETAAAARARRLIIDCLAGLQESPALRLHPAQQTAGVNGTGAKAL